MTPWYDNFESILKSASTFKGLHELKNARHEAGYKRNERMNEWCILGKFILDSCGNFGQLEHNIHDVIRHENTEHYTVFSLKSFWTQHRNVSLSWTLNGLPLETDDCAGCGERWELRNCHDFIKINEKIYHKACNRCRLHDIALAEYTDIFALAGFENVKLKAIQNQYCPCDLCEPWFLAETNFGTIKIGWRKRVINIDWSLLRRNLNLTDDNVTKAGTYVHAYGKDKAIEYLKKLRELVSL